MLDVQSLAVRLVASAALGIAGATSAAGQTPAPPPPPVLNTPVEATTNAGPVRKLTIDEAVALALEQNVNLQVERITPRIQEENVAQVMGQWKPVFSGSLSYNDASTPPDSFLQGTSQTLATDRVFGVVGVNQLLPWGQQYAIDWDASRFTTNDVFNTFNPRLGSNLSATFIQPLWRNFSIDSTRQQVIVSKKNREISDVQLRGVVVGTIRNVKTAYWDLKYAIANLEVQRQSLELARQTMKDNRTRVEVGTMAPIDIVEAEAEVARNEENVIVAEGQIRQLEDRLRALVFDPAGPDFWRLVLDPVDSPVMQSTPIDIDAAVQAALAKRTDLQSARKQLENVDSSLRFYRNQTLPQFDFRFDLNTTGLGGTQLIRDPPFPPGPVVDEFSRGFWPTVGDVYGFDFPAWTLALNVSYPLGKGVAKAAYARTQLEREQGLLQIKDTELQIGTQVRDTGRQANTNMKRVDATRAARVLAERRLEAEQKKFGVGMSTSFLVFQAQRDLSTARVNELQAILDYNKALVDFEAVQETSLTGGFIQLSGGGGFQSTTQGTTIGSVLTGRQ